MKLEEQLRECRKKSGLSQIELAERLDVSRQAISRWESGKGYPSMDNLRRLAEVYGVSLDALTTEKEKRSEEKEEHIDNPQMEVPQGNPVSAESAPERAAISSRFAMAAVIFAIAVFLLGYFVGGAVTRERMKQEEKITFDEMTVEPWPSGEVDSFDYYRIE